MSKAFDCVNIEFLIHKLQSLGIRGNVAAWIQSYLSERKLYVQYFNTNSSYKSSELGVPQGSVLGPLLFLIFINDLPNFVSHDYITLYADDVTVGISANNETELIAKLDQTVNTFHHWCSSNKLILNSDKTSFVLFSTKNSTFTLSKCKYRFINTVKFLGVTFDSQLSMQNHVDEVCKKLSYTSYSIRNLISTLDTKSLLNIYYAFAYSTMSYNVFVWGHSSSWKRVFILQKRILRLIFKLKFNDSCRPIFNNKNILTFPSIVIFEACKFAKQHLPEFSLINDIHNYNTRSSADIYVPPYRLTLYSKGPFCFCATLYNLLPADIKCIRDFKCFKNKLHSFLLQKCFYSINEFLS